MIVFTVIGVIVSVILIVFFGVIGYGELKYNVRFRKCDHEIFDKNGQMHDHCLKCGK